MFYGRGKNPRNLSTERKISLTEKMDGEVQQKVKETVLEILRNADMEQTTEYQIRTAASDRLGMDLSVPDRKRFVRQIVESFLIAPDEQQHRESVEDDKQKGKEENVKWSEKQRELDENGDLVICHLSNKRKVTIQDFKGKTLVSIREFYEKEGRQFPSSKGISLTTEQWKAFKNAVPSIEEAIAKLK